MNALVGAAYGSAAAIAELMTRVVPARSAGKVGKAFSSRRGLRGRYDAWASAHRDRSRRLVWFHAASVGEGMMALPVLQRLQRAMPDVQTAFTFFSPSAERFALQTGADFTDYLPFDSASAMRAAIAALSPTALVFARSDVWPVMVREAIAAHVRTALVSASMPAHSMRTSSLGALITRDAYAALDATGAASSEDAERIIAAGARASRVRVTGDTRYDQAWARANVDRRNIELVDALASRRPTLVAGSTWPADEHAMLPAWITLRAAIPEARIFIAPHELGSHHLESLERWARSANLTCARLAAATTETDVVLVDRMGVLADLYRVATVAYVGGGFHDAGLHSIVEPAVFGVPVMIGPRHASSRDAQLMLRSSGAVSVHDAAEFARVMTRLMSDQRERADRSDAIGAVVAAELGAADRSFEIVRELLRAV